MPGNTITVDSSVIGWIVAAGGALITFLLGLGVKDLRGQLDRARELADEFQDYKLASEQRRGELLNKIVALQSELCSLEQRFNDLRGIKK